MTPDATSLPDRFGDAGLLKRGTLIRAMSPVGHYWRGAFCQPNALYSADDDLVFIACHFNEADHEGDYYSEFDDPMVEEVLLLAALSLSIGWDGGSVTLYPHNWTTRLPELLDLADPAVKVNLRKQILNADVSASYPLHTDPPPPHALGGPPYSFRDTNMPLAIQQRIFAAVDPADHLLIRGLGAWLKGKMLLSHTMFALEALYSLYVALDASFSLVCRELEQQGIKNPDAWDAGAFIDEAEGREAEGYPFFGDFYVDRIRTLHPQSRYGIFPYAPVSNCDALTLAEGLREIFRLLILGEAVDPQNYPSVTPASHDTDSTAAAE